MDAFVNTIKHVKPLHDHVIVTDLDFGERRTASGIVITGDDGKSRGIRPRWGRIYAVGPDQNELKIGQYIYITHGRWTRGVTIDDGAGQKIIHRVDNDDILLVSDQRPTDDYVSDKL